MPYPAQFDRATLIRTAAEQIQLFGVEHFSLKVLADQLKVKPPSLYKHFESKNALLQAVSEATSDQLFESVYRALTSASDSRESLVAAAHTYRQFGLKNPVTYLLIFSPEESIRPAAAKLEHAVQPLQAAFAALVGQDRALIALRGFFALIHGWIVIQVNGQFQRGGDLDATFDQVVESYLAGITINPELPGLNE